MQPKYIQIKRSILDQIESGTWHPGTKISSENELATQFSVSRMTARKALDELCAEAVLMRSQGLGTFVSDRRPMSSMLEIHNIADEIEGRGHRYTNQVLELRQTRADQASSILLGILPGEPIFHSRMVHFENNRAIQFEDRYVNPKLIPEYLDQDFSQQTPNAYLSIKAPLTEADHIVEAVFPDTKVARALDIDIYSPCLKITRRTWSKEGVVSFAYLTHPGDRYRLGGHLNF